LLQAPPCVQCAAIHLVLKFRNSGALAFTANCVPQNAKKQKEQGRGAHRLL
jgi:hypothetical protein